MRIRISIAVEVDPEAWNLEYGTGTKASDIREDVLALVRSAIDDSVAPVTVVG